MDEYRSCLSIYLYLSIQLSICIRFLYLSTYIYNCISTYLYIHLSLSLCFSLVSSYQDKNKLKMYTAMCWVAEGPHRFMKMFVALLIFFITFWGCSEKLTALLRDWVGPWKGHTSSFAILNRTKGKTWRAVKEENVPSWAEINYGLSKKKIQKAAIADWKMLQQEALLLIREVKAKLRGSQETCRLPRGNRLGQWKHNTSLRVTWGQFQCQGDSGRSQCRKAQWR